MADIRTSDWSLVLLSNIGRFVPRQLRGRKRVRAVRELIVDAVKLAAKDQSLYGDWMKRFEILNAFAVDGSFHTQSLEELQSIIDGNMRDHQLVET